MKIKFELENGERVLVDMETMFAVHGKDSEEVLNVMHPLALEKLGQDAIENANMLLEDFGERVSIVNGESALYVANVNENYDILYKYTKVNYRFSDDDIELVDSDNDKETREGQKNYAYRVRITPVAINWAFR